MGNTITQETRDEMEHLIRTINSYNCPTIDIGTRNGSTGYLDFIKPEDTNGNDVVKGTDRYGRIFIVVKALFILSNNDRVQSFSTFFQRYDDNLLPFHCCGHYGLNMMTTEGGITLTQLDFLDDLLQSKEIELNKETIDKCRLQIGWYVRDKYNNNNNNNSNNNSNNELETTELDDTNHVKPVKIKIGWD